MSKKNKILVLAYLFSMVIVHSQQRRLALADEKYDLMAYMDAARLYEGIIKKDVENEEVLRKLGNSYFFNANFEEAEKWYSKLFEYNKEQAAQTRLRYLHVLKVAKKYEKMKELSDGKVDMVEHINKLNESPEYFFNFETDRITIQIEDAGINSENSDYGTSFLEDDLIFTSSRALSGIDQKIFEWTNKPFSNLFKAKQEIGGGFHKPKEFLKGVNTKFNESTAVFTTDGKTMFFTRNDAMLRERKKDNTQIVNLKIYRATLVEGKWTDFQEMPFNSDVYNCAHPALSADEKILYFVSNMPGTIGQSDLYKVRINGENDFGTPENLGTSINTVGRETFPFVSPNGELFFASDGHFGLGGLDIFVAKMSKGGIHSEVLNLGDPINSSKDDFGFFIDKKNSEGFFSSNRDGGQGGDDIYKFEVIPEQNTPEVVPVPEINTTTIVQGVARDEVNGVELSKVEVTLYRLEPHEILANTLTDENGNYSFAIERNQKFRIEFKRKTHTQKERRFNSFKSPSLQNGIRLDVSLQPILDAKVLANLNKIYFNSNDSYIRTDASLELDKLVVLMLETYPEMVIKIEAHTDPVGSHEYNDWLSQRRATSTYNYLVSKGVPENRIVSYTGFGKRKPINECTEANRCTPEELELNRRTEFPIISLETGK
ncbi:OmpA family protein [Maribacter sp. 2307UL18-2]|uniref:OmpA family protein n=1 Tax=Maribacter sp. 2307UL18-2 TaxID=3386274 RepID=UPI0039BD9070